MTHRLCALLIAIAIPVTLMACETTPLHTRLQTTQNPGVTTEIGKPLAAVNQVVPAALERCGFVIDKRQFVNGIVSLEAASSSGSTKGMRVSIHLSALSPQRTQVQVIPDADEPEGVMLQMINFIRDAVWK